MGQDNPRRDDLTIGAREAPEIAGSTSFARTGSGRTLMRSSFWILIAGILSASLPATAQQTGSTDQIDGALLAAPESLREGAAILGSGGSPRPGDVLSLLRKGTNDLVCLADDPEREDFHVACYHVSLDPFMRLGRVLRAEGLDRAGVLESRYAALEAGEISMPEAAALYSLTAESRPGPGDESGADGLRRLTAVYLPNATLEGTGLPGRPVGGHPWLMLPGTPWAHIMISR